MTPGRRSPAVFVALAAAAAVLALITAAVEPYLAAAGNAAATSELDRMGTREAGLAVTVQGDVTPAIAAPVTRQLRDQVAAHNAGSAFRGASGSRDGPGVELTVRADPVRLEHAGAEHRVRLVGHTTAGGSLQTTRGEAGDGLTVPAVLAEEAGLEVGDTVGIRRGDASDQWSVRGVYQALTPDTAPEALEELAALAEGAPERADRPLDLVFAPPEEALEIAETLGTRVQATWHVPAPEQLSDLEAAREREALLSQVAGAVEDPRTPLGAALAEAGSGAEATSGMGDVVREADRAVAALAGPARAVGVAGQAVALAVMAAAALFAARHGAVELRMATVRGQGPLVQGARAAGRSLTALGAGAVLGWAAALGLVGAVVPTGSMPASTPWRALAFVGIAVLPAIGVIVGVTAAAAAATVATGSTRRLRRLARAPWELAALALAGVAVVQLQLGGGLPVEDGAPRLSPAVLAFPVLLIGGCVGLAARVAARVLPALRRAGAGLAAAPFLAVRRLGAASGHGLALSGASALALGIVVYAAALFSALDTAVEEKASLQVGADAVAPARALPDERVGVDGFAPAGPVSPVGADAVAPARALSPVGVDGLGSADDALAAASEWSDAARAGGAAGLEGDADRTTVLRARARLEPSDETVDVLLVDPATFGQVATASPAGADQALHRLEEEPESAERLAVIAGGLADAEPAVLELHGVRLPIDVVERAEAVPGQASDGPALLISRDQADAFARAVDDGLARERWNEQVWVRGPDAAERLVAAGVDPDLIRQPGDVASQPRLVAVTWALGALAALAMLTAGLALVGVLLYVAVRQRETQVSYALARRMGLGAGTHRWALALEVLGLLAVALAVGIALGLGAATAVVGGLDPLPDLPPQPRTAWPGQTLAWLAGAVVLVAVSGAAALQRGADRADVAEVLRRA